MTSQILTEVHAIDPMKLEECIQDCPAGTTQIISVPLLIAALTSLFALFCHSITSDVALCRHDKTFAAPA